MSAPTHVHLYQKSTVKGGVTEGMHGLTKHTRYRKLACVIYTSIHRVRVDPVLFESKKGDFKRRCDGRCEEQNGLHAHHRLSTCEWLCEWHMSAHVLFAGATVRRGLEGVESAHRVNPYIYIDI